MDFYYIGGAQNVLPAVLKKNIKEDAVQIGRKKRRRWEAVEREEEK